MRHLWPKSDQITSLSGSSWLHPLSFCCCNFWVICYIIPLPVNACYIIICCDVSYTMKTVNRICSVTLGPVYILSYELWSYSHELMFYTCVTCLGTVDIIYWLLKKNTLFMISIIFQCSKMCVFIYKLVIKTVKP